MKLTMSLRRKLIITMLVVGVLPALVIVLLSQTLGKELLEKDINEELQYISKTEAREIEEQLEGFIRETRHLADNPILMDHIRKANRRYLKDAEMTMQNIHRLNKEWIAARGNTSLAREIISNDMSKFLNSYQQQDLSRYGELFITDVRGAVTAMTRVLNDYYQADKQWWYDSYNGGSGKIFVDDRGYDKSANGVVVGMVVPVYDDGQVVGVLKINFKLAAVLELISKSFNDPELHLAITRSDGQTLFSSNDSVHPYMGVIDVHASAGNTGFSPIVENRHEFLAHGAVVGFPYEIMSRSTDATGTTGNDWQPRKWYVITHSDSAFVLAPIKKLQRIVMLVLWLVILAVIISSLWLGRALSVPLENIRNGFKRVSQGDLEYRVETVLDTELNELASAFNEMTGELQRTLTSRDQLQHEVLLRERIEENLRQSEQRFRGAFEQAAVGIAHVGLDGSWLRVNHRLCDILGYDSDELRQKTIQNITHPDDIDTDMLHVQELLDGKADEYRMEKRYIRKDGSTVWATLMVKLAKKPDGSPDYFISIIEDIDEKIAMKESLYQLNSELEQRVADRTRELYISNQKLETSLQKLYETEEQMLQAEKMAAMGTFAAGIAHELNNPLTGVLNYVQYVRDKIHDEKLRDYLDKAEKNTLRAAKVIDNMLSYSRRSQPEEKSINIATVIEQSIEIMRPELNREHIDIELDLDQELPLIKANADTLEQVFINLMGNARDAMEGREKKLISIRAIESDNTIHISVTDTGSGIPGHVGREIFDPFFTTKPPGKGTGLGLGLCQRIISNLGGTVTYHSDESQGTSFYIQIPVVNLTN